MATDLNNLSISELKKIKKDNQQKLKKEYEELKKKQKLIEEIIKIQKTREKINKNQKPKPKTKTKSKTKAKAEAEAETEDLITQYNAILDRLGWNTENKIAMSFDEYFKSVLKEEEFQQMLPLICEKLSKEQLMNLDRE